MRPFNLLVPLAFAATYFGVSANAASDEPLWLYCEATRVDDGTQVAYTFKIEDGVAYATYGSWAVAESEREIRLVYLHENGDRDEGAFITINRLTGELYHNAYDVSVYRTAANDRPCQKTEPKF